MSKLDDCLDGVIDTALETCWEQWRALQGDRVSAHGNPPAMIDPEALVLASLRLRTQEKRLDDMLLWIADESGLMSLQRFKAVAKLYPPMASDIAWFAGRARAAGDARWRDLATAAPSASRGRPGKLMPQMSLRRECAFVLRLRSGLGVGIKADVIACLEGMRTASNEHAGGLSVADLATLLSYSTTATRKAVDEMARAGVVTRIAGRPSRHRIGKVYFQSLVREAAPATGVAATTPPWGYCAQVFAILLACDELARDEAIRKSSEVVQASRLRDLHDRFAPYWSWFGVDAIEARDFPGEHFIMAFRWSLAAVMQWAKDRL